MTDPYGRTVVAGPLGKGIRYRLDLELEPSAGRNARHGPSFLALGDLAGKACVTVAAALLAFLTLGNKIDTVQSAAGAAPEG